ncbi:hypothetical protein HPB51_013443 [Rhipicephalus microplus]|uniref:Uncharacterized protein n=1 Tax=Rhipicephalus microplus TaxID=6941 RepID=A0A9J6DN08_RHIMP|nr:hypothetical protein HPB51_013443 [Rhipicephalus microplus]
MCYTLDLIEYAQSESTFLRCKAPWTWELGMKVYWSKRTSVAIEDTNKFPVIVHRPETCPPDKLSAIVGETDIEYVLSVTQIVEAFGYMGGYLGMWLGFSLLSILKGLEEKILDFFFGSGRVTSIRIPRDATKEGAIHSSLNHRMLNRRVRALRMKSY